MKDCCKAPLQVLIDCSYIQACACMQTCPCTQTCTCIQSHISIIVRNTLRLEPCHDLQRWLPPICILTHTLCLLPLPSVQFKQQTSAYYFADDMTYGGASYVSTGTVGESNSVEQSNT